MILIIDVICEWSWLSNKLFNIESFLVIFGNNINNLYNFHVFIVESTFVLLNSELVALSVLVNSLVDGELLDLSTLFLDIVPDDVATSRLKPGIAPGSEVILDSNCLGCSSHMLNEVRQLSVLEGELLEVGSNSNSEHLSTEVVEHLVEPISTFSIRDTIKDILSHFCVNYFN